MLDNIQRIVGSLSIWGWCLCLYIVYLLALAFYRLYLSPIAHFPGSKMAAISGWNETYLDVFKGGQFTFQIQEWHKRYGLRLLAQCLPTFV